MNQQKPWTLFLLHSLIFCISSMNPCIKWQIDLLFLISQYIFLFVVSQQNDINECMRVQGFSKGVYQCESWSPCEAQNCWKAGKLRYRSNSSPAAGRAADAFVAETTAPRPCCQTNTSEQLHSSASQTTLRVHTWLLSPRSNVFTVSWQRNSLIETIHRPWQMHRHP